MSLKRFPNAEIVPTEILGEELKFPNGRTAQNRFLKAAMTERLSTYSPEDPKKHGLPTEHILNIYDKWGHGQFGMTLTAKCIGGSGGLCIFYFLCNCSRTNLEAIGNAIIFKEGDSSERRFLYTQWAQKMKQDGSLAIVQLSHAGRQTPIYVNPHPWSASDVQLKTSDNQYGKPIGLTLEQIRPVFKNTVVYLTGGFRTVGAMVDAIQRDTTQGIGLGRPVTAEPDLPKKILNGTVPSAVKDEFNQNEMGKTIMASCSQIEQMGRKSVEGAGGDVMDQISDFTDGNLVAKYDEAVVEFMREMKEAVTAGRTPKSIIVFN
ncbi:hypothetical protein CAEBREN_00836 [Caenorhabditis brenneri]|uniref:NADH:flavin oxidoreductase/NADH oxidase N-terminal domain-containing protein n=1 Tax=Caenorhabditis brenneri TaxID=135651 RepID=G0PEL3_CAEBE|nr:hypothetical protein CAEBREN_00836 [Caenorhabditis brenneri]